LIFLLELTPFLFGSSRMLLLLLLLLNRKTFSTAYNFRTFCF
jgi:hypothetical protein